VAIAESIKATFSMSIYDLSTTRSDGIFIMDYYDAIVYGIMFTQTKWGEYFVYTTLPLT
jgi:hypothetical protein